jgi:hypothetical protein
MLYLGCVLAILIGFIHSYLGEKYILIRLLRRDDLPKLLGSDWFTKRVLRFAWHITTLAWWGFAAILYLLAEPGADLRHGILLVTGTVFLLSGALSAGFTQGKHLSWVVFWAIAGISFYSALN